MTEPSCNCETWQYTVRQQSNDVIVVAKQCTVCGRSLGNVKKDQHDIAKLPHFSDVLAAEWRLKMDDWRKEQQRLFKLRQNQWFVEYTQYLGSEHWRTLRQLVLRRDPICQRCFENPSQQAHHVSYESYKKFGVSFPVECCGVCLKCHEWLHARRGSP